MIGVIKSSCTKIKSNIASYLPPCIMFLYFLSAHFLGSSPFYFVDYSTFFFPTPQRF